MGIYYQMFNEFKEEFSRYFGCLFEEYVGLILKECFNNRKIISESEIRKVYPKEKGKAPDWIIIESNNAILIECKATHFTKKALTTSFEEDVQDSLRQVFKGFEQLKEFKKACDNKKVEIESLKNCNKYYPILTTYEDLYLINDKPLRDYINSHLTTDFSNFPWLVLSIKMLQTIQPYLNSGYLLTEIIKELYTKQFNDVFKEIKEKVGDKSESGFLYSKYEEVFKPLFVLV